MPVWLRHGGFWLAVAVLAVVAPALWLTREGEGPLRWPVAFVREAVAPAQRGAAALVGGVRGTVEAVAELGRLREENAALRREADRLPALESALEELRQENERLRELLQFRDELRGIYPYEGVAARVIGRSPDAWYGTVTIDKGSAAGVREGMVVVE
ncbi:MAG: rod shape-determining protein MreC, partial [Clostridia bacterium]|nr:rod shape-determining protein MreC [Clostridia bacterium]